MFRLPVFVIIALVGIACAFCFKATAQPSPGVDASLAQEASRRSAELDKQKFVVPYALTTDGPMDLEAFVAPYDKEHVISLWFATAQGTVDIKLKDPEGQPLVSWRGTRGEWRLEQKLAPGKYVLRRCPKTIASFRETSARCCSSILDGMSLGSC